MSSLLKYIVAQKNQYALECMGREKFAKWTAVTVKELETYMGFMSLMGIVNLPALRQRYGVDETMITFKGRSSVKQYLPKKPVK